MRYWRGPPRRPPRPPPPPPPPPPTPPRPRPPPPPHPPHPPDPGHPPPPPPRRVRHYPLASAQARPPRHRNRLPRPSRLCRGLPGCRTLPPHRGGPDTHRAINRGAVVAPSNPLRKPPAPTRHITPPTK